MPSVRSKAKTVKIAIKSARGSKQAEVMDKPEKKRQKNSKVAKKVIAKSPVRRLQAIQSTVVSELKQKLAEAKGELKNANMKIAALKKKNDALSAEVAKMGNSDFELVEYCREKFQVAELARLRLNAEVISLKELLQATSNFTTNEREELLERAQRNAIKYRELYKEKEKELEELRISRA